MSQKLILPEETDNVLKFQPLPGGKDPTDNWLARIEEGVTFVSRRKFNQHQGVQLILDEWTLINKTNGRTYLLKTNLNQDAWIRVLPEEFSKFNELIEVLKEEG